MKLIPGSGPVKTNATKSLSETMPFLCKGCLVCFFVQKVQLQYWSQTEFGGTNVLLQILSFIRDPQLLFLVVSQPTLWRSWMFVSPAVTLPEYTSAAVGLARLASLIPVSSSVLDTMIALLMVASLCPLAGQSPFSMQILLDILFPFKGLSVREPCYYHISYIKI